MKKYSRKQFIQLSAAASVALLLNACGAAEEKTTKKGSTPTGTQLPEKPTDHNTGTLDLVYKDDQRYDKLRIGFNKRINRYPFVIALCRSTDDVAAAVRFAREKKLTIAVKSGGHSMEGLSCNDGGMVINLSNMKDVTLLEGNRIKAGPGCTLSNLYDHILPEGRLLPAGSCGTVGLGGLALGGGYGLFSKKYGLTCDHLTEATMVDGLGNIHNTKDDPELLWALKGGGTGNFGVVTEMVFETHAAPTHLQAHYFKARKLTAERASSILQTWMTLSATLPDSCFSGFVLNGSTLNILITNYDVANEALPPLLQKLAGVMDEFRSSRVGELSRMLKNYYGRPGPLYFRNSSAGFFKGYSDVEPFIRSVFEKIIGTPGMMYQVNTLGGKVNDPEFEKRSSFPHRSFGFISELQAYWSDRAIDTRTAEATTEILKITESNGINRQYVNYCSLEFSNWEHAYYADNYTRLQKIKQKYDPDNNIHHAQGVKIS